MDDVRDDRRTGSPWGEVATGFAELGDLLRSGFTDPGSRERSREELRRAWTDFATAAQGLGQALATTVNDPEIRAGARRAFGSLLEAIDSTVRDVAGGTTARARQKHGPGDSEGR